jgi:tetratricopeptide (TPR) repeat protein
VIQVSRPPRCARLLPLLGFTRAWGLTGDFCSQCVSIGVEESRSQPGRIRSLSVSLLLALIAVADAAQTQTKVTPETRGDIFMARKMYREAIDAYKEGPRGNAVLLNKTGIAYHQMADFGTAKKYYELAIKAKPGYAEAINNLGTIYYALKSYQRAIDQYKKALRYSADSAAIYTNLGTAYFVSKNYVEASAAYEKALSLAPDVLENRRGMGGLLQERSVEERAKFHYYVAKIYAKAGNNGRALEYMRKSIEEGFKDKGKFQQDPEFAKMRDLPEFKEILTVEERSDSESQIKSEIESIESAGQSLPLPEPVVSDRVGDGSNVSRTLDNKTPYILTVLLTGPIDKRIVLPAGTKQTFEIPPGRYKVAAQLLAPDFPPLFGVQEYVSGHDYKSDFVIE